MRPTTTRMASRAAVCVLGAALAAAGCGGKPIEPDETPPDLTGDYTIVSFTSGLVPGDTLSPPEVSGDFSLVQTAVQGQEASGTLDLSITVPTGTIAYQGTYRNRFDGSWEQESPQIQARGTYTLENNVLTVVVTEPPLAVSTTVWRRG